MSTWSEKGTIQISNQVVATIASIATLDTNGISGMSGGIVEGIARTVSGRNGYKGAHALIENEVAIISLQVVVKYGPKMNEIAKNVQYHVKEAVENMTGFTVQAVHVRIEGVDFKK